MTQTYLYLHLDLLREFPHHKQETRLDVLLLSVVINYKQLIQQLLGRTLRGTQTWGNTPYNTLVSCATTEIFEINRKVTWLKIGSKRINKYDNTN